MRQRSTLAGFFQHRLQPRRNPTSPVSPSPPSHRHWHEELAAVALDINRDAWATPHEEARLLDLIPCGRVGAASDVAKAAVWLASHDSDYVTGATLYLDGGMTLYLRFAAMVEPMRPAPATSLIAACARMYSAEVLYFIKKAFMNTCFKRLNDGLCQGQVMTGCGLARNKHGCKCTQRRSGKSTGLAHEQGIYQHRRWPERLNHQIGSAG